MSVPTTLGEYLRWIEEDGAPCDVFRRVLYGTDEPCPECKGQGWTHDYEDADGLGTPCPNCHGTGRIKTPGLAERIRDSVPFPVLPADWFAAIRREIGESPR